MDGYVTKRARPGERRRAAERPGFGSVVGDDRNEFVLAAINLLECASTNTGAPFRINPRLLWICPTPPTGQLFENRIQQKLLDVGRSQVLSVEQICAVRDDNWPVMRVISNTTV